MTFVQLLAVLLLVCGPRLVVALVIAVVVLYPHRSGVDPRPVTEVLDRLCPVLTSPARRAQLTPTTT